MINRNNSLSSSKVNVKAFNVTSSKGNNNLYNLSGSKNLLVNKPQQNNIDDELIRKFQSTDNLNDVSLNEELTDELEMMQSRPILKINENWDRLNDIKQKFKPSILIDVINQRDQILAYRKRLIEKQDTKNKLIARHYESIANRDNLCEKICHLQKKKHKKSYKLTEESKNHDQVLRNNRLKISDIETVNIENTHR